MTSRACSSARKARSESSPRRRLRLFPNPRAQATAFVGLESPEQALALLALARERIGGGITTFELIGRMAYDITVKHGLARAPLAGQHAWYVMMEASSQVPEGLDAALAGALETAFERGIVEDAAIAASLDQRHEFWKLREGIPEAQIREGGSIKHDVSVAVGDVPGSSTRRRGRWRRSSPARASAPSAISATATSISTCRSRSAPTRPTFLERWDAMNEVVHGIVARLGGSFSAEHGVGRLKRELLARTKDPATLAVMRAIKAALDPNGIMNPGKVL